MEKYRLPLLATVIAVAITATMDFTGYLMFSAFPLIVIIALFWFIQKLSKQEIGLKLGSLKHYGMALLYPASVLSLCALAAYLFGDFSPQNADWNTVAINVGVGSTAGILVLMITEEGFFRGWLWGSLKRSGLDDQKILLVTSAAFVIWHISAVVSGTEYGLPFTQVPVYLVNGMLLGLIWGLLRLISGSVIVPSVCHAVWNAFAYALFGFGEEVGALGIENTFVYGPEVGYLGILLNGAFYLWLLSVYKKQKRDEE